MRINFHTFYFLMNASQKFKYFETQFNYLNINTFNYALTNFNNFKILRVLLIYVVIY